MVTTASGSDNFFVNAYKHANQQATQSVDCGYTWRDNQWPWVSLTWQLYNLQLDDISGADFENSLYIFSQLEKR